MYNKKRPEEKIFNFFGRKTQQRKLAEEVYEFLEAVIEYESGNGTFEHVIEEYSDVKLLLDQFGIVYKIPKEEVLKTKKYKIQRTMNRYNI